MSYASGPYAKFTSLPVLPRPKVHSARNIAFATLRYTIDSTTGGFEKMPPIAQKVALLLLFDVEEPKFNTEQGRNKLKTDVRNALADMARAPNPEIRIEEIVVERDAGGSANRRVVFTDLTNGQDVSIQLT